MCKSLLDFTVLTCFLNLLFSPLFLRMRSEALLSLLFILALSDGALTVRDRSKFDQFMRKHALLTQINTSDRRAWLSYMLYNKLCDRSHRYSFIQDSEENITEICNKLGRYTTGNLFISTRRFRVYMVDCVRTGGQRVIEGCTTGLYHVTVGCQFFFQTQILPVHYEGQDNGIDVNSCF